MAVLNGFVIVSSIVLIFFFLGFHNYLTNYEDNGCNMTYLFEYPQFVRISLPSNVTIKYQRYGLYAFGEGRAIEKVRAMKFTGIPVLFIPGSRGSPKQVRSLASVSLRKTLGTRSPFHFDYFAVDLNDDQSGLFGGVLQEQTKFVHICVEKVLSLYKMNPSPTSVVLIGHSMGGLIAKGLFLEPEFNTNRVKVILTLATPHSPALLPDHLLARYYDMVDKYWENKLSIRKYLTVISIGGGARDLIVSSSLTETKHADINILSSSVADVWLSVDHYCILWCKELVLVLVRALFDCVDPRSKQITNDVKLRKNIFAYHLVNRTAGKRFESSGHGDMVLWNEKSANEDWLSVDEDQWSWEGLVKRPSHLIISLATVADTLVVEAVNHRTQDWLFACNQHFTFKGTKFCKNGENLSGHGRIVPSKLGKRKSVKLNLSKLRMDGSTHVVIRTLPSNIPVKIWLEVFKEKDRKLSSNSHYLKPWSADVSGTLMSSIEINSLHRAWHVHLVRISSDDCDVLDLARIQLNVPWDKNYRPTSVISGSGGNFQVGVLSSKPAGKAIKDVRVDLYLNPQCNYNIKVEKPLLTGLGAMVGKCGTGLVSSIAVVLLMTLAAQIRSLDEARSCPLLHTILPVAAKPYYILPAFSIFSAIARMGTNITPLLPQADIQNENGLMDALFIPLFLHCSALALTYFLGIVVLVSVVVYGQTFNTVLLRFVDKVVLGVTWLSEHVMSWMSNMPILVSGIMVAFTFRASGGLCLALGLVFYFFKLISLYEDFWQEIVYWPLRLLKAKLKKKLFKKKEENCNIPRFEIPPINNISFHLTMIMLWGLVTVITIPSILTWAKNYRYSTNLDPDPFFYHGVILSVAAGFLWQADVPKLNLRGGKELSHGVFGCGVLSMVYCRISLYRLATILTGVIASIALHQAVAPFMSPKDRENKDEMPDDTSAQINKYFLANPVDQLGLPDDSPTHNAEDKSLGSSDCSSRGSGGSSENEDEEEEEEEEGEEEEEEEAEDDLVDEEEDEVIGKKTEGGTEEEKTPSSDISSSSFENISIKDTKE